MTDCPVCLNEFTASDLTYPLQCRTVACDFNYCVNCIENFVRSASDGYQEASDGSRQVKIQVKCPQCREKYQCKAYSSEVIVEAIILLRKAATLQETTLRQSDSDLSATELASKHDFLESTSMEELQDAVRRLQVYQSEIQNDTSTRLSVPPVDWELWRTLVRATPLAPRKSPQNANNSAQPQQTPSRDPSLFYGLDELMTVDEQEFVTSLLTSGHTESLMQAAQILNGILDMAITRNVVSKQRKLAKPVDPVRMRKLRNKYPLPRRMPRCVKIPSFDPDIASPFKFESDRMTSLVLKTVKGIAGRLGLRCGDMVTHVNGNVVQTKEEYKVAIRQEAGESDVWLTVNADMEVAHELHKRAQKMQQDKVYV